MPCMFVFPQQPPIRALTVGDTINDIEFAHVLNSKNKTTKLSAYKNKLVILDFWSLSCVSCIAGFPKMEYLQKQFNDSIQILLVNPYKQYDSERAILDKLESIKKRKGFYPTLPVPIHDTIMIRLFPHNKIPHQVWIARGGKIVAITGSIDVTEENIQSALRGNTAHIPIKDDWKADPAEELNNIPASKIIYRSIFTPYKGGLAFANGVRKDTANQITGWHILNTSLRHFITAAYHHILSGIPENQVITNSTLINNAKQRKEDLFCYEVTIPAGSCTEEERILKMQTYLQEDLKRSFGITVIKQKKVTNCLLVQSINNVKSLATKYTQPSADLEPDSFYKYIRKTPVSEVIKILNQYLSTPLIAGFENNLLIDLEFPYMFTISDNTALIAFLKKKGFVIQEEKKELDIVTISGN